MKIFFSYTSNKNYKNNGRYTFIGHSFGGLFAFYCLVNPKPIFKNIIALSPSLWVDDHNFFEREKRHFDSNLGIKTHLFHACGSYEWINKVLYSSRRMKYILNTRRFAELSYDYREYESEGHNGMVPISLRDAFKEINF